MSSANLCVLYLRCFLSSDAGGNVIDGCLDGCLYDHFRRLHLRNGTLLPFSLRAPHRTRSFIFLFGGQENVPRSSHHFRQCNSNKMFRYRGSRHERHNFMTLTSLLGVAVSYLIIIGDLMPQVIASIFPSAKSMPFLLDRQFWITAFMYTRFQI